jgi:hypothetical protein
MPAQPGIHDSFSCSKKVVDAGLRRRDGWGSAAQCVLDAVTPYLRLHPGRCIAGSRAATRPIGRRCDAADKSFFQAIAHEKAATASLPRRLLQQSDSTQCRWSIGTKGTFSGPV